MRFEDRPNYDYLRELLRKAAKNNGLQFDSTKFDQIIKEKEKEKERESERETKGERK